MSNDSLINRHRPAKFSQVVGQKLAVGSFKSALDDRASHAFLFTGPSGVGKTTLARLGAGYVGSSGSNVIDVDAATYSGIDDMRSLTTALGYRPLGKGVAKSIIIDEAHALSPNAWKSLLKSVEEPPDWVYWFFCTTDPRKVPDTIKTRCSVYDLKPVPVTELFDFLLGIAEKEQFDIPKAIIDVCVKKADGSPRAALSNLSICYGAQDRAEAAKLLELAEVAESGGGFELAKALAAGWKWDRIQPILKGIAEAGENPESVRHTVRSYFTTIAMNSKTDADACACLKVLDAFSEPCNPAEGLTPTVIALGRALY